MNGNLRFLALGLLTAATGCAQEGSDAADAAPIEFDPDYGAGQAKTLVLDEREIVYLEKGKGTPVVFYNPLPDHRYWQWQVDAVSTSYHAVAVYFPARAVDRTPEGLAAALEALDLGPVHLVSFVGPMAGDLAGRGASRALSIACARGACCGPDRCPAAGVLTHRRFGSRARGLPVLEPG